MELRGSAEWADIVPILQDDGPEPIVPIAYPPRYVEVMDYFRAIVQKSEISERAFRLTSEVINQNAANYSAWHYRRLCLFGLEKDLQAELDWVANMAQSSPKNYQLWHHVRALIDRLDVLGDHMQRTAAILRDDSKNYHVWSQRQWACQRFACWDGELALIDRLLTDDIRNNSAWNHRHFVVEKTSGFAADVVQREVDYTLAAIEKVPGNESTWNYLRSLMHQPTITSELVTQIETVALRILSKSTSPSSTSSSSSVEEDDGDKAALIPGQDVALTNGFLVDLYEKRGQTADAIRIAESLVAIDSVRRGYWNYRAQQLNAAA